MTINKTFKATPRNHRPTDFVGILAEIYKQLCPKRYLQIIPYTWFVYNLICSYIAPIFLNRIQTARVKIVQSDEKTMVHPIDANRAVLPKKA